MKFLAVLLMYAAIAAAQGKNDSISKAVLESLKSREYENTINAEFYKFNMFKSIQKAHDKTDTNVLENAKKMTLDKFIADKSESVEGINADKSENAQRLIRDPSESTNVPEITQSGQQRLRGQSTYDSRIELYQLDVKDKGHQSILARCESVGIVIEKENISSVDGDIVYIDTPNCLGKIFGLCESEAFWNQTVIGVGTAFIVGENTMLTAAHVLQRPLEDYAVVFGFRLLFKNGVSENFFDTKNVYYPKKVTRKDEYRDALEFSVDRNFDRQPLKVNIGTKIKGDSEVFMIGYPCGIPLKVSVNAHVTDNSDPNHFYTTLDSFMGNSGSPVFNAATSEVIGILVSGEVDFVSNGNCSYSPVCHIPDCKGEKVIRIETLFN